MSELIKYKVSICDESDYLVSTYEVEAFSTWAAITQALIRNGRPDDYEIRTVLCVPVHELQAEPF